MRKDEEIKVHKIIENKIDNIKYDIEGESKNRAEAFN